MMNRIAFEKYVEHIYECKADYPWVRYPDYAVYRHHHNRKWFAVVMDIPKTKLGLGSSEKIAVVNLIALFINVVCLSFFNHYT